MKKFLSWVLQLGGSSLIFSLSADAVPRQTRDNAEDSNNVTAKPAVYSLSDVAAKVRLHRSEVAGVLRGLGIQPAKVGSALVVDSAALARIVKAVEASRRRQPVPSK